MEQKTEPKKPNYSVIEGKLHNHGEPCPLEIGNPDQIKFLKAYQEKVDKLVNGTMEVEIEIEKEVSYTATASLKCLCGQTVFFEKEARNENHTNALLNVATVCRSCKRQYKIDHNSDIAEYVVKLSDNKIKK
jgi:hypothetical protein